MVSKPAALKQQTVLQVALEAVQPLAIVINVESAGIKQPQAQRYVLHVRQTPVQPV
jgi:hypothetical protein